jgi:hypothetical protein
MPMSVLKSHGGPDGPPTIASPAAWRVLQDELKSTAAQRERTTLLDPQCGLAALDEIDRPVRKVSMTSAGAPACSPLRLTW